MNRTFEIRHTPNLDGFAQFTIRRDGGRSYIETGTKTTNSEVDLFMALGEWLVPMSCPACAWFGMRDDCRQGKCPNCGARPERDRR